MAKTLVCYNNVQLGPPIRTQCFSVFEKILAGNLVDLFDFCPFLYACVVFWGVSCFSAFMAARQSRDTSLKPHIQLHYFAPLDRKRKHLWYMYTYPPKLQNLAKLNSTRKYLINGQVISLWSPKIGPDNNTTADVCRYIDISMSFIHRHVAELISGPICWFWMRLVGPSWKWTTLMSACCYHGFSEECGDTMSSLLFWGATKLQPCFERGGLFRWISTKWCLDWKQKHDKTLVLREGFAHL